MRLSARFTPSDQDVEHLVRDYPLALVFSSDPSMPMATPLPLLLHKDEQGEYLLGHFARSNPQLEIVRRTPRALAVFMGPHSYVSPSWLADRSQAPTWNYACVQYVVTIELQDNVEAAVQATQSLTQTMETKHACPWQPHELGARHDALIRAIVAFKARIHEKRIKFKLGQNERPDVLTDSVRGLEAEGASALVSLMRDANRERL